MQRPLNTSRTENHQYTVQELFSTAVLTATLVKALALLMVIDLIFQHRFSAYDQFFWLGTVGIVLAFSFVVYHLGIALMRAGIQGPAGFGYPMFALVLVIGILVAAGERFTYFNSLLFFPVVISALLLGRRGILAAFGVIVLLLAFSLHYRTELTAWYLSDNVLACAVLLFMAWLVGEAIELNHRANRSLSETSHFLQTVLDALPLGVLVQDQAGRLASANRHLQRLIGDGEHALRKQPSGTRGSAEDNLEIICTLSTKPNATVAMGEIYTAGGESIPIQVSRHPVTLPGNEAQVILVQNLSDRQKLRELDLMLQRLLEDWDVGVIFLDAEQRVRIYNQAASRHLGLGEGVGEDGPEALLNVLNAVPDTAEQRSGGTEIALKGRYLLVNRAVWQKSPDGRPWTVITVHDVTERKKTEMEIQRTRNLSSLGQIAAGVAHELRNPLTSIKGFAQLASEQSDPEKTKRYLDVVLQEAGHMQDLLDRFLMMAKPSRPSCELIDLRQIILWVWDLLHQESLRREIRLEKALPAEELPVRADPQLLRQVVLNLVNNAFDATPPGELVRVEASLGTDTVHLTVSDTGSGIPAHLLDEVFVPFFTTKEKGTGLGLAISHEIVRKHGGTLKAESSPAGTVFRVTLPRIRGETTGGAGTRNPLRTDILPN